MPKQFAEENLPPDIQVIAERMNIVEEKIPPWTAPPLPFDSDCTPLKFLERTRQQLIAPFREQVYGKIPPRCNQTSCKITSEGKAFGGLAIRRQIDIICRHQGMEQILHLLLYIPVAASRPAPVFFGLNFKGNHSTTEDPGVVFHPFIPYPPLIPGSRRWSEFRAGEEGRAMQADRWDFKKVLERGYATATMSYHDVYPDHPLAFNDTIMRFFYTEEQWKSPHRDTGAICAWVWGMQRCIDCLEMQPELDMTRLFVHGHSRLGKTTLWLAANDPRPAWVISSGAGACGDKMMHHYFGENFEWLALWAPHWFRGNFPRLVGQELKIPFDFHYLLAAIAPRRVYIAAGDEDDYADPKGQFASCVAASPAWKLFGGTGLGTRKFPACKEIIGQEIGFYLRHGGHGITPENWNAILDYADRHFR
ncbi:MAG: hypothetical protein GX946_01010 [Oligosphaeraceae bacterium]|nr:hypothetical protein [Oligosphaeraceae bacterium]